ncbi:MAG: cyclodeaminase/cyclohydrolase family protein [Patescibacteria group bacterium]
MGKSQALQMSIHAAVSATSLIALTCDNTLGNEKYEKVKNTILKLHKDVLEFNKKLLILETDYQKNEAGKVGKDNFKKGIKISLEVRRVAQAIEKLGYRLTKIGDKNMHADARTAIHLAHAASKSALENIKANKTLLKKLESSY